MEEFRELLRRYTKIYTKHVLKTYLKTKDFIYNNLKGIINNKYHFLLKEDKDSNMFTIDKSDYASKVHQMIDESIKKGV